MWNNQGGFQSHDQGGQGFNSPGGFNTPQQSQEKRTRQRAQNIIPVTISEIINSTHTDEKYLSGDVEIMQVTFVGVIRSVTESATRIDYEIDDMSGPPMQVKQFPDSDEEGKSQSLRENTYVRVVGQIREFNGLKNVVAFNIKPLNDMNELTHHILDVVHAHASLASSPSGGSNGMMTGGNMTSTGFDSGDSGAISGLSAIQNQVHMVIRNNPTSEGASLDSVFKQIRGVPEKAIRDAIEFLSGEGHIYSTVDDDHFKATDS